MSNIPKLRFKEFSQDLEEKKYGDIYSFYTTNSFSRDNLNYIEGDIYNIHYGDIHTKFSTIFHLENEHIPYINVDVNITKIKDECYCQVGDLVIADASEDYQDVGKTIEVISLDNKKTLAGLHTFLARPNKFEMALGYAGHMLQSWNVRKQVMTIAQGSKVLGIATSRLAKIKLNIPSKEEQEKIANFLTQVDTKIKQLVHKESLLQEYKKGVMQKIFNQEIRFKDDDGSEFCDWRVKKLKEITTKKSSNISANTLERNTGQYKIYGASGHLKDVDFYTEEKPYISIVKDGAGVGRVLLCDAKSSVLGTLDIIQNNHNMNLYFIYLLLSRIHFEKYVVGSTIPHIYYKDYSSEKIQVPCLKEQAKIARFLSEIDSKIDQTEQQLNSTKEFKKALLQQMFV